MEVWDRERRENNKQLHSTNYGYAPVILLKNNALSIDLTIAVSAYCVYSMAPKLK